MSHLEWLELEVLHIDHNRFSGSIPAQLMSGSIVELKASRNLLSGELPATMCDMSSARLLDLSNNQLAGSLCEGVSALGDLKLINLSNNRLQGELPASIGNLKRLTTLNLSRNRFVGELPREAKLTVLQVLDLSSNRLTGELPAWVGRLPILASANLRGNAFATGLEELAKVKTLQRVDISENNWSVAIPQRLNELQNASANLSVTVIDAADILDRDEESPAKEPPDVPPQPTPPLPPPLPRLKELVEPTPLGNKSLLRGTVRDVASATISEVKVVAESPTGSVTTKTDASGQYELALPAGDYRLTFSSPYFIQAVISVHIEDARTYELDMQLEFRPISDTVLVEAGSEGPRPRGPWWNSWITRRGVAEDDRVTVLRRDTKYYSFYLELSGSSGHDEQRGIRGASVGPDVREHLIGLYRSGVIETSLYVRIQVIGRSVALSGTPAASWSLGNWAERAGPSAATLLSMHLPNILADSPEFQPSQRKGATLQRGGAVRFGIEALQGGCAKVVVSIWDESGMVPLDNVIHAVGVDRERCFAEIHEQEALGSLYGEQGQYDVTLNVLELRPYGETRSASIMVFRGTKSPCESYRWDSDATLTDHVLNNNTFRRSLDEARRIDKVYSSVGEQIADAVFPSRYRPGKPGECGAAEAFEALKAVAKARVVRMLAKVVDERGRLAIVPFGLLAMYEEGGQRVFANDIRVFQPITRQTLERTGCVNDWTLVLPSELEGSSGMPEPPDPRNGNVRVLRSKQELVDGFIMRDSGTNAPTGLLLLAHHDDGVLTFSGPGDHLSFTRFDRDLGNGSIAVISACKTTNLTASTKLVTRLNEKGVDAIVAASFELDIRFGVTFAYAFSDLVTKSAGQEKDAELEDVFSQALAETVKKMTRLTSEKRARGMSLELVLAGNPKLKICPGKARIP